MASINDYKTPRDRVSGSFLEQLLREESENDARPTFLGMNDYKTGCTRSTETRGCKCNRSEVTRGTTAGCNVKNGNRNIGPSLAMVYSPFQEFTNMYCEEEALSKGTLFEDLYLPFEAYCCGKKDYGRFGGSR